MKSFNYFIGLMFVLSAIGFTNSASALDMNFPSECPNAAQDCADQICADGGGTLYIEAGDHVLGPVSLPGLPPFANNLLALCSNFSVKGLPGSSIDATGSQNALGAPMISLGALPFDPVRRENVEASHLTFHCDDHPTCAFAPVAVLGADGVSLHHNVTHGFSQGLNTVTSNDVEVDHNMIYGRGAGNVSFGINLSASGFPPFLPAGDPALTLTSNQKISGNIIVDTSVGINLETLLDSEVSNNFVLRGQTGLRVRGAVDLLVKGNIIADLDSAFDGGFSTAGLRLSSVDDSKVLGNLIADTTGGPAMHFANSNLDFEIARNPDVFTNGNANNKTSLNLFLGYDPDACGDTVENNIAKKGYCFSPPGDDGSISDGGGNKFFLNIAHKH